ncbi:hypothetical protein [Haloferula sargassicola]|uniref:Uncharacterized protein n=1 Tax=Haloferula sargassicola TaxID=490096 RepID=A0ABP9UN74_9BACT
MLTREAIAEVERIENAHHKAIHSTCACRNHGPKAWKAWEDAASAWHAQRYATDRLWEDEFLADLRGSDRQAIDEAILFLEVDPWYFRSGYLKERLIRGLKAAQLTERDRKRLRNVIWNVAGGKNRREYRDYCSLAAVVGNCDLVRLLEDVSPERDLDAKGKFGYLLSYLQQNTKLSEPQR